MQLRKWIPLAAQYLICTLGLLDATELDAQSWTKRPGPRITTSGFVAVRYSSGEPNPSAALHSECVGLAIAAGLVAGTAVGLATKFMSWWMGAFTLNPNSARDTRRGVVAGAITGASIGWIVLQHPCDQRR